jgi:hypothetical protein
MRVASDSSSRHGRLWAIAPAENSAARASAAVRVAARMGARCDQAADRDRPAHRRQIEVALGQRRGLEQGREPGDRNQRDEDPGEPEAEAGIPPEYPRQRRQQAEERHGRQECRSRRRHGLERVEHAEPMGTKSRRRFASTSPGAVASRVASGSWTGSGETMRARSRMKAAAIAASDSAQA